MSKGKKKRETDEGQAGDPDIWMDTLSDLVFLMITFFVLLISMSSMDSRALKAAFGFFDDASSVLKFPQASDGTPTFMNQMSPLSDFFSSRNMPLMEQIKPETRVSAQKFFEKLSDGLMDNNKTGELFKTLKPLAEDAGTDVRIIRLSDGVEIMISGRILIPRGGVELDEEAKSLLEDIAIVLQLWGGEIEILATWSWYEGPAVLANIISVLENKMIPGRLVYPELYPGSDRKVRFILRKQRE